MSKATKVYSKGLLSSSHEGYIPDCRKEKTAGSDRIEVSRFGLWQNRLGGEAVNDIRDMGDLCIGQFRMDGEGENFQCGTLCVRKISLLVA